MIRHPGPIGVVPAQDLEDGRDQRPFVDRADTRPDEDAHARQARFFLLDELMVGRMAAEARCQGHLDRCASSRRMNLTPSLVSVS